MSDIICGYTGDRETMLMAYLYEEIAPPQRDTFEAHLATCARCRVELHALGGVRAQLARWSPPVFTSTRQSTSVSQSLIVNPAPAGNARSSFRWREIPAWAQVAAALLVLGVSAGIANLNVHYDAQNGLNIHTGWTNPSNTTNLANASKSVNSENAVTRDELARLEQQLRMEIRTSQPAAPAAQARTAASTTDEDTVRRLKAIVEESERRQQREIALRVAELLRDVNAQRQSDLRKIDLMQDQTGVEVLRTRQQMNYLLQRVSQRQ